LELDGYCPELKSKKFPNGTAIESQGYQHYWFPNRYHRTKEAFLDQKKRDMRKRIQCLRHGVLLICIPYWKKDIGSFIRGKMEKAGIICRLSK
jgi:hypothetical protein